MTSRPAANRRAAPPAPADAPPSPRERILAAAHDLFYRDGIRATGIDAVIAAAGVTKVTFYRQFPSKNDLVRAFLDHRHDVWMAWFVDALGRHGAREGGGTAPLLGALEEWFSADAYRGCAFLNTVVELGSDLPEVRAIARRHKADMTEVIAGLLPAGDASALTATPSSGVGNGATGAAEAIATAVDGAILRAQMDGAPGPALAALGRLLAALDLS
ncbi:MULTISPECIES: TetR/AcrR family transcriptional regulator [Derxia]|uniref:TetR/AcrR family transcriptional regulator n=1 Tax=Derxia gummosa DSM 723 TaxID=1121388 RepID=A0A8B6XAS9_9BURK|nr:MULTISPECIES: TetR/AcrR family transcriptional regulator [Derxia]